MEQNQLITETTKILKGKIIDGYGEGKYYISLAGYQKQFKDKLSLNPFPGTLNLKINKDRIDTIKSLYKPISIDGFVTKQRTFGKLDCYRCKIENDIHAFIIFIERTTHDTDIIEIISEKHIRKVYPDKKQLKITLTNR